MATVTGADDVPFSIVYKYDAFLFTNLYKTVLSSSVSRQFVFELYNLNLILISLVYSYDTDLRTYFLFIHLCKEAVGETLCCRQYGDLFINF